MKERDTAGKLLWSTGAATISQVWRYGVAFVTRVVLRRGEVLVTSGGWGLWHWAAESVFGLLAQLRDLGLPAQVVRSRPRPYGNFLAVELIWGGAMAVAILFAAPWVAWGFAEAPAEELTRVLRLLVLFFLFEGVSRVPLTFFEAELRLERTVRPEVVRNLVWAGLAIALALLGHGYWSLFIAHVVATATYAAMLWWRARADGMRLVWITAGTFPLVRKSLPLMLLALLFLSLLTAGVLILGVRFSPEIVGMFGAALELSLMVSRVLELPIRRPLYPALVAYRDQAERFAETYRLATVLLMALQLPAALFLVFNAERIVVLLFAEEYAPAAQFLQILAFAVVLQPFGRCAEDLLLARNEERVLILAASLNLCSLVALGWWLTSWLGPVGLAWAHLVPVGELLLAWAVWRLSRRLFRRLVQDLAWVYLLPVPLFLGAALLGPPGSWARVGWSVAAGALVALLYAWRFGDGFVRFFRQ